METTFRTLTKSVIWALVGWVVMSIVGLAFTGSLVLGGAMAALNSVIGFATYIIYERLWTRIEWGRNG